MAIYLPTKNSKGDGFKTVDELLDYGFQKGLGLFVETYKDPDCKYRQCHVARRSFTDLLEICNTYFPGTGKERLAYYLMHTPNFITYVCSDINKLIFRKVDRKPSHIAESMDNRTYRHRGEDGICYLDVVKWADNYVS